jgi:hypothetical protein
MDDEGNSFMLPKLGGPIDDFPSWRTTLFFIENHTPAVDKSHFEGDNLIVLQTPSKNE